MRAALITLALLPWISPIVTAKPLDTVAIERVFASLKASEPGCALMVQQRGEVIHVQSHGVAELAFGAPITASTVFDIGSVSKQFTALALLWLVHDGKLGLDDPVRQHLPELAQALPPEVTVRRMLQHSAGLPDYVGLMSYTGQAPENVTGDADALRVINAGVPLNFVPGSEASYSNTGYFLAGQLVQRLSGQTLDAFLKKRLFAPLGMQATHVRTDHTQVVPQRATAYAPGAQGFVIDMSNWNQAGDGAVQSNMHDLALWEAELIHPRVVPPQVIEWMQTPGRLTSGQATEFGMGWIRDTYRGLPRIFHDGAWGGFRTMALRFPTEGLAITLACNRADADVEELSLRVADIVLAGQLDDSPAAVAPAALPAADLARLHGWYLSDDGSGIIGLGPGASDGTLSWTTVEGTTSLQAIAAGEMRTPAGSRLRWSEGNHQRFEFVSAANGLSTHYRRVEAQPLDRSARLALAGLYAHAGLGLAWRLSVQSDGSLRLEGRGLGEGATLEPVNARLLRSDLGVVHVQRDAKGRVTGLRVADEGVRHLVLRRR